MTPDFAFVAYNIPTATAVASVVQGYAAAGMPDKGPGVTQGDAVQLATHLAVLRNAVTYRRRGPAARYVVAGGEYQGTVFASKRGSEIDLVAEHVKAQQAVYPIVGDERLYDPWPGSGPKGKPNGWGPLLALALDNATRRLATAERADAPPPGYGAIAVLLPPLAIGIIVGGVAVTVIGAVAAWRYLDPDARKAIAITDAASKAYSERLAQAEVTGIMPPASPIEEQALPAITDLAATEAKRDWIIGGAIVGGIVVTAIGGAAVSRMAA